MNDSLGGRSEEIGDRRRNQVIVRIDEVRGSAEKEEVQLLKDEAKRGRRKPLARRRLQAAARAIRVP
jgi:hypothetical protein